MSNTYYRDFGEKINVFKFNKKKIINNYYNQEKRLIKGYIKPIVKDEGVIINNGQANFISEGELYYKNKNLLEITNPIAYNMEQKQNKLDLKYLQRKIDANKIKNKTLYHDGSSHQNSTSNMLNTEDTGEPKITNMKNNSKTQNKKIKKNHVKFQEDLFDSKKDEKIKIEV